ncbi:MAG TPA: hypothetical protein VFT44_13160 [Pyrinomonadaceae bacterium]|nr:hypothetical protein [Pyrinomonadaceae bacterium]
MEGQDRLMVLWETNRQLGPEMWDETKLRSVTFCFPRADSADEELAI